LMTVKVKGGQQQDYHAGRTFPPSHLPVRCTQTGRAGLPEVGHSLRREAGGGRA